MKMIFPILAIGAVLVVSAVAMEDKDKHKTNLLELKQRCEELSKETGEEYLYGEGVIRFVSEYILPAHSDQNPKLEDFKGYFYHITSDSIPFEEAYITATNARFGALPKIKDRYYAFCYKTERNKRIIINYPETMILLEE